MPVKEADPQAQSLDAAFAEAMGAPAVPKAAPPPPPVDREAPHGRGDDGAPLAPFGYTKEGTVRRGPQGRKAKPEDKARVSAAPAAEGKKGGQLELLPRDYTRQLGETADAVWLGLTFAGQLPLEKIPVLGKIKLGKNGRTVGYRLEGAGDKIGAQAAIVDDCRGGLVGALNMAANHSPRARRLVERLETGDASWVLVCGAMVAPFLIQTRLLWEGKLDAGQLAADNRIAFEKWTNNLRDQIAAAAAAETIAAEVAA